MQQISCIICAYNEAGRIERVLDAVQNHPRVAEVIVVDDGSSDQTASIVARYPSVRLIRHDKNQGKSRALVTGIRAAAHDTLLFLDADLIGLSANDITALVEPVVSGTADVSMSIRKNSLMVYRLIGLDFVSGERVLHKSLVSNYLDEIAKLPGFGVEVFMNRILIQHNARIKTVYWDNVIEMRKSDKMGWWRGLIADFKMIRDILTVVSPGDILVQNYKIFKLSV